jgi:hypothetical protein
VKVTYKTRSINLKHKLANYLTDKKLWIVDKLFSKPLKGSREHVETGKSSMLTLDTLHQQALVASKTLRPWLENGGPYYASQG